VRRVLLIANANAHTVTPYAYDVIARALAAGTRLEKVETKRRGHATHVARGAAHEGVDLVVVLGGDGTVNEVVNGLAGSRTQMAALPGGGANIFARGLGMPNDPVEATGWLLDRLDHPPTRIPLGRIDGDRWFVSNCGFGFDAAIVRSVERRQFAKRVAGDAFFVWTALKVFFTGYDRRHPRITVSHGEDLRERREGLFLAISQKGDPYTYLGARPMRLCPEVRRDGGLDLIAVDRMRTPTILRIAVQSFTGAKHTSNKRVFALHDQARLLFESDIPLPLQVDGELIGERTRVDIRRVPDALSILT
jgi:diacylglycerol kinase family enzyme